MADSIEERIARDRALYAKGPRQQLIDVIKIYNSHLVGGAIAKSIELQIITEEIAREHGIEITDEMINDFLQRRRDYFNSQLKRALTSFIGSIVSQEG